MAYFREGDDNLDVLVCECGWSGVDDEGRYSKACHGAFARQHLLYHQTADVFQEHPESPEFMKQMHDKTTTSQYLAPCYLQGCSAGCREHSLVTLQAAVPCCCPAA